MKVEARLFCGRASSAGIVRDEAGVVGVKVGQIDLLANGEDALARFQHHVLIRQALFVFARLANHFEPTGHAAAATLCRRRVVHHDAQLEGLAAAHVRRHGHFFHDHIAAGSRANRQDVDADAIRRQAAGLLQRVADVLVSVADQHDAAG